MNALIVVSHPNPSSLTHSIAGRIAQGITNAGHVSEIADLTAEGFDPRFGLADFAVHHREAAPPADVLAEQARIDRADALVLVFPIFWWSMPGLLKGWIDRVFSNGWAFDYGADARLEKKLQRLKVHLVAIGGGDAPLFERHGYAHAMKVQIDHGIFDYCGAEVVSSHLMLDSETEDPTRHLETATELGRGMFPSAAPARSL